ncbi:MAG: TIGR04282 family arsenosugar biosynthesis glycosyltransferase [Verrucomicrobiota bacterium]
MRRLLLVFLKFPQQGRVKTRLAAEIGPEKAVRIYRQLVEEVFLSLANPGHVSLRVTFDPPEKVEEVKSWITGLGMGELEFCPQGEGDLGNRMRTAFLAGFNDGFDQICVIGTDTPEIDQSHLSAAWTAMEKGVDLVFGPALDGGFYLFATTRPEHLEVLQSVSWSQNDTLEQCLKRADARNWHTTLLTPLRDIDTLDDWLAYGSSE